LPAAATPAVALLDAVRLLRRGTALVVGDAMLDRYVYGQVTRVSPEAPVPVLTVERELALPGGAGNVVRNLTALGVAVAFVSVVGDDQAGSDLTGLIGGQPGVEPWLLVQGGRATTTKTRFVASGQQMMRADHEQTAPIHHRLADRLVRIASDAVAATAVLVLSDYGKGVLAEDTPTRLIAAARAAGRRVVVDPKGLSALDTKAGNPVIRDFARFAGADLIIPEAAELAEATGLPTTTEAEISAAAAALLAAHGFGAVLVIRGEAGLTLAQAGAEPLHLRTEAVEVLDPAGAGDAVVAMAAAAMGAGLSIPIAARLAALAAGIVQGKTGIAVVREDEMREVLTPGRLAARKIASRAEAVERVERWRRRGHRIGFITGIAARPAALTRARDLCDRLVVAVAGRADGAEAAAIAALAAVDVVTAFEGETPVELIRLLRPDILMQGGDVPRDTIPGGDLLHEWGGELRLMEA
jgi:D-beta-D-heptose 7-phosphate kinase/D-beta-D-heptose 1-phosphate adenosyltransferase